MVTHGVGPKEIMWNMLLGHILGTPYLPKRKIEQFGEKDAREIGAEILASGSETLGGK